MVVVKEEEKEGSCKRSWGYRGERMGVDDSALSSIISSSANWNSLHQILLSLLGSLGIFPSSLVAGKQTHLGDRSS